MDFEKLTHKHRLERGLKPLCQGFYKSADCPVCEGRGCKVLDEPDEPKKLPRSYDYPGAPPRSKRGTEGEQAAEFYDEPAPETDEPEDGEDATVEGKVDRIVAERDGWMAGKLMRKEGTPRVVSFSGSIGGLQVGSSVKLTGVWETHPKYGRQFKAKVCEVGLPTDAEGFVELLMRDEAFKGIGPVRARSIVTAVESQGWILEDALKDVNKRAWLATASKVPVKTIELLAEKWKENAAVNRAKAKLLSFGISANAMEKLAVRFGSAVGALEKIQDDPYFLFREVDGFGFQSADEVAQRMGVKRTSEVRLRAGVLEAIERSLQDGHTWTPRGEVMSDAYKVLGLHETRDREKLKEIMTDVSRLGAGDIEAFDHDGERALGRSSVIHAERELLKGFTPGPSSFRFLHGTPEKLAAFEPLLNEKQRAAVLAAMGTNRVVITGVAGCIDGDAEIRVNRAGKGYAIKLKELYRRFNRIRSVVPGIRNGGRLYDRQIPTKVRALVGDQLRLHRIVDVVDKGVRPVVKMVLASGKALRLTPDHEVCVGYRDGEQVFVRVDQLQLGAEVLTNGRRIKRVNNRKLNKDGYVVVLDSQYRNHPRWTNEGLGEHIIVAEAKIGRPLASDEVPHHKNKIKHDNRPENIEVITDIEHKKHHGREGGFLTLDGSRGGKGGLVTFIPVVDTVVSVEPDGETHVYDIVCDDPWRNFVANGVVVHNCGKTYTISTLVRVAEASGLKVAVCAPTGKAAKRLEEVFAQQGMQRPASTVHRLLAYGYVKGQGVGFQFNKHNPLPVDIVICDEASMLDVRLAWHLLDALPPTSTLVLVGDHNQIPPVGAGAVLRDLEKTELCPIARLVDVVRQAGELRVNSLKLLQGKLAPTAELDKNIGAAPWVIVDDKRKDVDVLETVLMLFERRLEKMGTEALSRMQIISPQRKGKVGVENLNVELQRLAQSVLYGVDVPERGNTQLLVGDKVIQTRNDYDLDIMNGDQGVVVSKSEKDIVVEFGSGPGKRNVVIPRNAAGALVLAYAITCHKSQGSQWDFIIIVCHKSHQFMWHRNLLYTAVTRSSLATCVIGDERMLSRAVKQVDAQDRRTLLSAARKTNFEPRLNPPLEKAPPMLVQCSLCGNLNDEGMLCTACGQSEATPGRVEEERPPECDNCGQYKTSILAVCAACGFDPTKRTDMASSDPVYGRGRKDPPAPPLENPEDDSKF